MYDFTDKPLLHIYNTLHTHLKGQEPRSCVEFVVLNPDIASSLYNGTTLHVNQKECIYRGYKTWIDLAHQLNCRMLTPKLTHQEEFVIIRFEKLSNDSFHNVDANKERKYGKNSIFAQIHKNEESGFLHYYLQSLLHVNVEKRKKILNLGVNHGDEFELIAEIAADFQQLHLTGIDYCESAIQMAQKKFTHNTNVDFFAYDINTLDIYIKEKFDLIISIGTLQSTNINLKELLPSLLQNHLEKNGAMIIAFPNCRWRDGEMLYGAKMRNYNFSEMSNLYKDVVWCKKYLQQKKFRVTITGKDYIFITATSIQ